MRRQTVRHPLRRQAHVTAQDSLRMLAVLATQVAVVARHSNIYGSISLAL
jgi:hypothetical protein